MRWTVSRRALRALLPALLVVLLTGVASGQAGGRQAPGFTLTLLDGTTLSLADLKGSPVVLLFWAPW
jgi:cytochrome c biogenesis protein CcmG, thiol:disulfide interchange protein DsbE